MGGANDGNGPGANLPPRVNPLRIGLVSDTHGRFAERLIQLFARCDAILHAGDVMGREVLDQLASLAPVTAVKGNNDYGAFGVGLEEQALVQLGGLRALVIHVLGKPEALERAASRAVEQARPDLVVYGHSHKPAVTQVGGILFVNPGAAGPRRFALPRTAGLLTVAGRRAKVDLFDLDSDGLPAYGAPLDVEL